MALAPPLVERATALAAALGFERSSSPETGRLLHLLAAQRGRERVGEIGTGTGVGTAWMAAALPPGVRLYTAEPEAEQAAAATELFRDDADVHVLHGPWREVLPAHAPFDLLFYDGGGKRDPATEAEEVVSLLAPGGTVVLDDVRENRVNDPLREWWLRHPRLVGVELAVSPAESVLVCVRAL